MIIQRKKQILNIPHITIYKMSSDLHKINPLFKKYQNVHMPPFTICAPQKTTEIVLWECHRQWDRMREIKIG